MKRIATGVVLAAVVYYAIKLASLPVFVLVMVALAAVADQEFKRMLVKLERPAWPILSVLGQLAIIAAFLLPDPPLIPVLTAVVILVFCRAAWRPEDPARQLDRVFGTLAVVLYCGLSVGHAIGLRVIEGPAPTDRGDLLAFALFAVYLGDTSAYYGGRAFGRHRLAPTISPAKTIEGALAGVVGAVGGALIAQAWFVHAIPIRHAALLGGALGIVGIFGDLFESLLKRAAGVKDSGTWLPGHGGILDRTDSLFLAVPIVYWYQRLVGLVVLKP